MIRMMKKTKARLYGGKGGVHFPTSGTKGKRKLKYNSGASINFFGKKIRA